jgi:hypothetical protein
VAFSVLERRLTERSEEFSEKKFEGTTSDWLKLMKTNPSEVTFVIYPLNALLVPLV